MSRQAKPLYEFGAFCLDIEEGQLFHAGQLVPLTPKAYETLRVLVENSGSIVEKGELMRTVWPDVFVEEGGLTRNISVLRKVLTNGAGTTCIQTILRRGYRLMAQVRRRIKTIPFLCWLSSDGREETSEHTSTTIMERATAQFGRTTTR